MGCGARAAPAGTCSCPPTPAPALADYLEHERPRDTGPDSTAVFLSAASIGSRRPDGRLSVRAVNLVCEQIGRWHDADHPDPARHLSPLRPHDLRHSFAYRLSAETGHDAYELQRRLGHQSQRYIERYTNPPEDIAAGYVEGCRGVDDRMDDSLLDTELQDLTSAG